MNSISNVSSIISGWLLVVVTRVLNTSDGKMKKKLFIISIFTYLVTSLCYKKVIPRFKPNLYGTTISLTNIQLKKIFLDHIISQIKHEMIIS